MYFWNPDNGPYTSCCGCGRRVPLDKTITCSSCQAVSYCSENCRVQDLANTLNPQHAHEIWCKFMKHFMDYALIVQSFPFEFTTQTTSPFFYSSKLFAFLRKYGVFTIGLWKYLFHTTGSGPGDSLKEWNGLLLDSCRLEHYDADTIWQDFYRDDNALMKAYASPADVVMLSVCPQTSPGDLHHARLLTVDLSGWEAFYSWRGLSLSSPLAFLFHWPLTLYYILNKLFPATYPHQVERILRKKTLNVHIIGVEAEVDLLPVFKELEFLISPTIEEVSLNLIGPNVSPYASGKKWLLSHRLSASIWRGHYHEFFEELRSGGNFCLPDLVIGFNVGFAAYPSWKRTLEVLKAMNVPCFFTDSCQYSCIWDFQVMDAVGLGSGFDISSPQSAMSSIVLNPFRSPVRIPTEGTRWPWFSNAFVFSPRIPDFNEEALATKLSCVQI